MGAVLHLPFNIILAMSIAKHTLSTLFILAGLVGPASAQTLRGIVRDADNGNPVLGATVAIRFSRGVSNPVSMASDLTGEFVFEKIRPGYYSINVMAQGFENQTITEINVASGKEQVLEISLRRSNAQLAEMTVSATQTGRRAPLPLGEIPLTRDQTLRFPAMFFDPARLAAAYPGVAQTDDGTNMLSIRGNSPASVRWRLEGLDIVNPNHLPNAGTFSDRPAGASGGVLMFSAQLLDNSSLLTGAMPAGYGDALGGIFDMNLRKGNARQHEFTAQAGLIGLDLAAEGPLRKGGKSSYLANYRYSTVGLLGQLGVSFGDEQINFQDFSFHLNFPTRKGGRWSVFGLGGLSENRFRHKTDTAEIKTYKDFFDIDFESKTGVLGVSNWTPFGKNTWLKTAVAVSGQTNERLSVSPTFGEPGNYDEMEETKISGSVTFSKRIGNRAQLQLGSMFLWTDFVANAVIFSLAYEPVERHDFSAQPWAQYSWKSRNQKNTTTFGLHGTIFKEQWRKYNDTWLTVEPRFAFSRKLAQNHRVSFAAGIYSQVVPPWLIVFSSNTLSWSSKIELGYTWDFAPAWQFKTSIFGQRLLKEPYFPNANFAQLNNNEIGYNLDLSNFAFGRGNNQGIEFTVERRLIDGWFLLANTTLLDSKFSKSKVSSKADWLSSRWDIGHIVNATFGKEWQREKSPGKERTIGLNLRGVWTGGVREADFNFQASQASRTTIIDESRGYHRQYPDYFRLDLRVYWRKNLGNRRNSTFALDIQNLTGQQNLAYHFYDPFTDKIETKYQLSTIPNFSWRVEF